MIALLIGIAISLVFVVLFLFWQAKGQSNIWVKQEIEALRGDFRDSLSDLAAQVNSRLNDSASLLSSRLDNAARVFGTVNEHLGRLHEASTRIFEIGKDISSLQELLRPPKIRGGIGEFFLESLLAQVMPRKEYYQMQYMFKNGQQVDAVIKIGANRMVPIDSKFPLENFRVFISSQAEDEKKAARKMFISDVKKHIADIAAKYILPDEGTFDFALMYIPAENVYYETIIKDEKFSEEGSVFNYSLGKKVIPVSPNSFYAYLQVILVGLKGMAIEKETQQILASLDRLRGDFDKFYEEFSKIGRHLGNSRGSFEEAERRLHKIHEKILQLSGFKEEKVLTYDQKTAV